VAAAGSNGSSRSSPVLCAPTVAKLEYIRNLDGVRGVALLMVVFCHLWYLPLGWIAMQVFFVLSGFLITRILVASKQPSLKQYLGRFYVRRLLRIFPVYYGYILGLLLVMLITGYPQELKRYLLYLVTYTYNWTRADTTWQMVPMATHFWSLAVEEQFYLVWPFAVFFLPTVGLRRVCVVIVLLSPALRWWLGKSYTDMGLNPIAVVDAIYWNTFAQMDGFAWGALLALLPEATKRWLTPRRVILATAVLFFAGGIGFRWLDSSLDEWAWWYAGYQWPLGLHPHGDQHIWGYTVLDACAAGLIYYLASTRDLWLLTNRFIIELGRLSYGMYVLHVAAIWLFQEYLANTESLGPYLKNASGRLNVLGVCGVWIVLYGAGKLVYVFYERPFLRLKSKFAS
jgi:peptidoglycan/LPS O-acetylase OafA/YrhL